MGNEYLELIAKFLSKMAEVKAPTEAYIEGLEIAIDELKTALDAAQYDLKNQEET
jgi:hypothetical protein